MASSADVNRMAGRHAAPATDDPFQDLFTIEDGFYDDGFRQGHADGERAGRVEGRTLGLETGFTKFVEAGRLQGKAVVWANQLTDAGGSHGKKSLKNLQTLYSLVEPGTLSTANTDEAVNDVDDRVRRAQAKARVLEKKVAPTTGAAESI